MCISFFLLDNDPSFLWYVCFFEKKYSFFLYDSSSRNGGGVRSGAMRRVSDFSVNDKCIIVRCDARK